MIHAIRFGTIYEFELDNWAIGPQVHGDLVNGHWTLWIERRLKYILD